MPLGRINVAATGAWMVCSGGDLRSLGESVPAGAGGGGRPRPAGGGPGSPLRRRPGCRSFRNLRAGGGRHQENTKEGLHCGPPVLRSGSLGGGGASDRPGSTVYTVVRPTATK